jgi:hypothetical protein
VNPQEVVQALEMLASFQPEQGEPRFTVSVSVERTHAYTDKDVFTLSGIVQLSYVPETAHSLYVLAAHLAGRSEVATVGATVGADGSASFSGTIVSATCVASDRGYTL